MKKIIKSGLYLASYIPFPLFYLLSNVAAFVMCHIVQYRKQVIISNLSRSFPEKSKKEIRKIARQFYLHFTDLVFESVKALTIEKEAIRKRYKIVNPDIFDDLFKENKSAIIYAAHYGNWEWFAFLPVLSPYLFTSFYQEQKNLFFDEMIKNMRSRFGVRCIESGSGYKSLLKLQRANTISFNIIIGDQCPFYRASRYWTTFLGQETAFLRGAEAIALKTGHALIYPFIKKVKRGHYQVEFIELAKPDKDALDNSIIESYSKILEENIRFAPQYWLWSHRRWKLKRKPGED